MKNKTSVKLKLNGESRKLNLGCGLKYKEKWINLDISDTDIYNNKIKVDVVHDLDKFPYPFPDDYFDEVLIDNVLEHLENPPRVFEELERICRNNAVIKVIAPHFSYYKAYTDTTHKHYFSLDSMSCIIMNRRMKIIKSELEISNNPLIRFIGKIFTLSKVIYERFLYGYFPVQGVIWTVKVEKDN
jgi:ubiquinone/menaquinone biosynthesis C-methylase UbiE